MAHNPENNVDPAGNTQMFRAFVEEQEPQAAGSSGGSRVGVILGVVAVVVVLAAIVFFAVK